MKTMNKKSNTYSGQPCQIVVVGKMPTSGRILYALRTTGGTVKTCFGSEAPLRDFANNRLMKLEN